MRTTSTIALVLALCLLCAGARAAGPQSMDYQGYLTDISGAPVDAATPMTFSIYNVETSGAPLWAETLTVAIDSGLFSVTLGNPANPFPSGLFETPLWIGIEVASDGEMTPRRPLTAAAFSFKAEDADTLQGATAAQLDQSAAVAALQVTVADFDTVLDVGAGGEATIVAPGGLEAANTTAGTDNPDLVVGGLANTSDGDDGIIASAPSLPGSDLIFQTNDAFVIELDNDGNGEDADFAIIDKDDNEIFDVEEDGQVRLHGATSMTAGDDPTFGPVLTFLGESSDQAESGRIRFREGTSSTNLRGGYMHYDGAANKMHIGVHDTSDNNLANDEEIITIERTSGQVGIGTTAPNRELTVNDTDGSGGTSINVTAPNRELLLAVNQSSGGIVGTLTNTDLQLRTNNSTRMSVRADGTVDFEGEVRKDYGSADYYPMAPLAMGRVDGSGAIRGATPNVSVEVVSSPARIGIDVAGENCTSASDLDDYVFLATPDSDVSLRASLGCNGADGTVDFVVSQTSFGVAVIDGFAFVIYSLRQ